MTTATDLRTGTFVTAGGISTHYHDAGNGDPVVLLHGSGPGVSAWANWQHTIPALAQTARVLALDLVGYGDTQRPDSVRYSLRTWTDHVWAFMDAHGIEKTRVIGNSLGGRIALQMVTDQPDRIVKMVLMGTPGAGMTPTEGLAALRAYEPSYGAMRELLRNYFAVNPAMITDELVKIRYEASIAEGAYEAYRAMFFDPRHTGSDLGITENEVRAITTPTLLIHGREDKVVALQVSVTMLGLLPNADLHVFSACGHWTQVERADEFSAVVTDYLGRS